MKIFIASDHAGFELKERIEEKLRREGHAVEDMGTHSPEPLGVGPFAQQVARSVLRNEGSRGILICGTGGGMSVAANRYPGIRALLCFDKFTVTYARRHNDANIFVLGARVIDHELALCLVDIFLVTPFEGGKYAERLVYLEKIEEEVWDILKSRLE